MLSTLIIKIFILAAITTLATAKTFNVMVINFDPVFEVEGKKLKQHELHYSWNDPNKLMKTFIKDMSEISYGNVDYQIIKNIELDELPRSNLGKVYTKEYYYNTLMTAINETDYQYWNYEGWEDYGRTFDYVYYLQKYDAFKLINNGTIDEVWFFTGPMVGVTLNETTMIGKDAYFVNGEPIYRRGCRNFIAYGFNYERGVGEMLEDAGHRMEFIMNNVYGNPDYEKNYLMYNDWEKFTAHELVSPGDAGVGSVHFAPNSDSDYDWGNRSTVLSYCANWLNYPDLSGEPKEYDCSEWGDGDIREHHKWWFKHIPHVKGNNNKTDKYNNWWIYFTLDYINNPPVKEYNVMVINFDPVFEVEGKKLKQHELLDNWNDPNELAESFIKDMSEISYGNVDYQIIKNIELDELPRSNLGKVYTKEYYYNTLMTAINETDYQYWNYEGWEDYGRTFDYVYYLQKYDAFKLINNGTIDEVWFFTGPMVGVTLNETTMIGKDAYFVNGEPIYRRGCRNFIAYGFNYERGVGEMLEDAGHRMEFIMNNVYGNPDYEKNYLMYNDWEKFTAHELVSPGDAGVGSVHFAPNSDSDYDWGNRSTVLSYCANWLNYPDLSGEPKEYDCSEWGDGDIREHHKWWFKHIPHVKGKNSKTDNYNNWWIYFTLDYINNPPKDIPEEIPEISPIEECTFDEISSVSFTGKPIEPSVTIQCDSKKLKKDTDYTVIYEENVNVGKAKIEIIGINDYSGQKTLTFKIIPQTDVKVSLDNDTIAFKGCNIKPQPLVTFGDIELKLDIDYTLSYKSNKYIGTGTIITTLQGNYNGEIFVNFKIVPKNISELKYSTIKDQKYNGKPIKPSFTISHYNLVLEKGKDYTVKYLRNTEPGRAKIIINGKGNYTGSKTIYFKIKN